MTQFILPTDDTVEDSECSLPSLITPCEFCSLSVANENLIICGGVTCSILTDMGWKKMANLMFPGRYTSMATFGDVLLIISHDEHGIINTEEMPTDGSPSRRGFSWFQDQGISGVLCLLQFEENILLLVSEANGTTSTVQFTGLRGNDIRRTGKGPDNVAALQTMSGCISIITKGVQVNVLLIF